MRSMPDEARARTDRVRYRSPLVPVKLPLPNPNDFLSCKHAPELGAMSESSRLAYEVTEVLPPAVLQQRGNATNIHLDVVHSLPANVKARLPSYATHVLDGRGCGRKVKVALITSHTYHIRTRQFLCPL